MQNKDFEWFIKNYDLIFKQYGQCYVVIKNKKVIGSYNDYSQGVFEASKSNKLGSFIVQKLCKNKEEALTCNISSINF